MVAVIDPESFMQPFILLDHFLHHIPPCATSLAFFTFIIQYLPYNLHPSSWILFHHHDMIQTILQQSSNFCMSHLDILHPVFIIQNVKLKTLLRLLTALRGCLDATCEEAMWSELRLPSTSPPASIVNTGKISPALKSQTCNLLKGIQDVRSEKVAYVMSF